MGAHRGAHSRALGAAFGRRAIPARSRLRSRAPRVRLLPRACLPRSAGLRLAWLSPARLGQPLPASLLLAPLPLIRPLSYSVPRPPFSTRPLRGQGGRPPPTIPARGLRAGLRASPAASLGRARRRAALATLPGGSRRRSFAAASPGNSRSGGALGPSKRPRAPPLLSSAGGARGRPPALSPPACAAGSPRFHSGGCPCAHGLRPWPTRASPVARGGWVGLGWGCLCKTRYKRVSLA